MQLDNAKLIELNYETFKPYTQEKNFIQDLGNYLDFKEKQPNKKSYDKLELKVKLTVTCDSTLFMAGQTTFVSFQPRDSSATFLLGKLVEHPAKSPIH